MAQEPSPLNPLFKLVLFFLAWISLVLGFIGIFLPILPTTPFVLLSGYLFSKSSKRFHLWLLSLPRFGPMLKDWEEKKVIRPKIKAYALSIFTLTIFSSIFFFSFIIELKIMLMTIWVSLSLFILTRASR